MSNANILIYALILLWFIIIFCAITIKPVNLSTYTCADIQAGIQDESKEICKEKNIVIGTCFGYSQVELMGIHAYRCGGLL